MTKEYERGNYRKRTELDVALDILRLISLSGSIGVAKTKIIQSANLSPQMCDFYFRRLLRLNLIARKKKDDKTYLWRLTSKGIKYFEVVSILNIKINKIIKELIEK